MSKKNVKTFKATVTYTLNINGEDAITGAFADEKKLWRDEVTPALKTLLCCSKFKAVVEEVA